jgi:uncharacterized membrane protein YdbT with pleckstrin-like domain
MAGHYVDKVLQPGEEVRYIASLNWILYAPGLLLWFIAALIHVVSPSSGGLGTLGRFAALLVFAAGLVVLARAWFRWWTTEIAVTDRRVIYKTGFISRKTTEMHMDKVESVDVHQSVLGRIFDFGSVIVRGTGSGLEPIRDIDAPLELRNHITGV